MVIKLHIYLLLVMAYMFAIQKLKYFWYAYFFVMLHETAHILIARLLKVKVYEIELLPIGVNAKYSGKISTLKELIISLAGPVTSLLLYEILEIDYLKKINLLIAITNLIPLKPYDGGRIVNSLLCLIIGRKNSYKTYIVIQKVCLNFLLILAIVATLKFRNYYLAIACIYMICIVKQELKNEKFNDIIKCLQID